MSKNCCKNKTETVKIKDNYIPTPHAIAPSTEITILAKYTIQTIYLSLTESTIVESTLNYLYPPDKPISLSLLYRSILI